MDLKQLSDNPGSRKKRMRVGRGPGSGKGKTAGRGVKGQSSRSGVSLAGFEGGQMPLHMRLPKRGFKRPAPREYVHINLNLISKAIDSGKIDPKKTIDAQTLVEAGVLRRSRDGVRLLAKGSLDVPANFVVSGASEAAIQAVEKLGGSVKVIDQPETEDEGKAAKADKAKKSDA